MARTTLVTGLLVTVGGLIAAATATAAGSTLYVDRGSSNCSDAGAGSATQPLCTIGAAAGRVGAGQTVQVAAGTYPESVAVTTSGTSAAPIVFTAAAGASVTLTGGQNGFALTNASWITVRGFAVTRTVSYGIVASGGSHVTIRDNHVTYAGQPVSGKIAAGIRLNSVQNSLVDGNTSDHNSDYGIVITNASTGNTVRNNTAFSNARGYQRATAGIRLYQSPGNVVSSNLTFNNEDSGIECYPGSNNTLLYNNVSFGNGDHGIDNYQTTGQRIIANSVYDNVTAGINVEGGSTGATIANNISVDNGIKSPRTHSNIRVEHGSTLGTTMNSDLVNLTTPDTMLIWDSVGYSSLSAFRSATGQEGRGIQADPRWVDPTDGDFRLSSGSPALDSADSGVSGQPVVDAAGQPRVDLAGVPNTGVGPRAYDDRGAFELQAATTEDQPPVADLSLSVAGLGVTADASGSSDTDGTPIATYRFDFGDGAIVGQADATATHTYTTAGSYTVRVTVTDTAGLSSSATGQVTVADNLVDNFGFETDLSGWNTSGSGSGVTLSRVAGGHSGNWAARCANPTATAATCTINDSPDWVKPTNAGTYTATVWVRADTAGASLKLRFREYSSGTLVGTQISQTTLTTSWQAVTVTYTPLNPSTSSLDLNVYVTSLAPTTSFYADDVRIVL